MKIITPGNLDLLHNPQTFTCNQCGCVFEATDSEYSYCRWRRHFKSLKKRLAPF